MKQREINVEIYKIRKQNRKLLLKKLIAGIYAILTVGVIVYVLLFLIMLNM